jgi:FkbM family methyltransferase
MELRSVKRIVRRLRGRGVYPQLSICRPVTFVGGDAENDCYGAYALDATGLHPESVVYSVGIGTDISFDLDLIRRYGVTVHAFDPTPQSLAWIDRQSLPDQLVVHPFGLASIDGTAHFFAPSNPAKVSASMTPSREHSGQVLDLPVRRLTGIMALLGHQQIDLLKLDIEGAEYEVIDDLIDSQVCVRQLLVEFHHANPGKSPRMTREAVERLQAAQLELFHVTENGADFSFARSGE